MKRRTLRLAGALGLVAALTLVAAPAWAAPEGRIQQVEAAAGTVTYLLSAEGLAEGESIDPASVTTTIAGVDAPTTAVPVTEAPQVPVSRTVMLTLDSSGSMGEFGKLDTAKSAAAQYLSALPDDVKAGLVAFADKAEVKVAPTTDRAAVTGAVNALQASGATALNDAVVLATRQLGTQGSRSIVLLSDGADEGSRNSARKARSVLSDSGVVLDAVSLGRGTQERQLTAFANAGGGTVVTATDANALTAAFASAARTVASQLAVTAQIPEGVQAGTSELVTTALVGDQSITDSAVAIIPDTALPSAAPTQDYGPIAAPEPDAGITGAAWFLPAVLTLLFIGLAGVLAFAIGAMNKDARKQGRIGRRLEDVNVAGYEATSDAAAPGSTTVLGESTAVRKAVSFADRVAASRDTTWLAYKLDVADVKLRPGEWAVVHALIVILAGLLVSLLTNFNAFWTLLAIVVAVVAPWAFLSYRASKRRSEFYNALPDSLQMLAGGLSAGYSLPQALDNVAREAGGTMGQELNRALIESRLGLPIEEALEAVAQRMESEDFHWTVMSIRINRQVGGNLAEVLTNVSKTVRERERLRRQVKALSAEGKLSAWILALLPILVGLFIVWRNPGYIEPLYTTVFGWVMIIAGVLMYIVGVLWMRNLVKMEV